MILIPSFNLIIETVDPHPPPFKKVLANLTEYGFQCPTVEPMETVEHPNCYRSGLFASWSSLLKTFSFWIGMDLTSKYLTLPEDSQTQSHSNDSLTLCYAFRSFDCRGCHQSFLFDFLSLPLSIIFNKIGQKLQKFIIKPKI